MPRWMTTRDFTAYMYLKATLLMWECMHFVHDLVTCLTLVYYSTNTYDKAIWHIFANSLWISLLSWHRDVMWQQTVIPKLTASIDVVIWPMCAEYWQNLSLRVCNNELSIIARSLSKVTFACYQWCIQFVSNKRCVIDLLNLNVVYSQNNLISKTGKMC